MEYLLKGKKITIEVIRKNNKNLYMRFKNDSTLVVTCNHRVTIKEIQKILEKNETTLAKMLIRAQKEEEKNQFFYYLGKAYQYRMDEKAKTPYFEENDIVAKDEKTLSKFYQNECRRIFESEVNRIVPYFPNIPSFSLKIRNMKTRWGVNNRGNNSITLNSELLKKDLDLIDYVIIHELCHFYEANHSSTFWKHVEEYYPKYKEARKRLRG